LLCVCGLSFAMSAEDITTVVTWPNFSVIIGPWMLESFAKEWCGLFPSLRRFPIMVRGKVLVEVCSDFFD
jgi:hypothetical protein